MYVLQIYTRLSKKQHYKWYDYYSSTNENDTITAYERCKFENKRIIYRTEDSEDFIYE